MLDEDILERIDKLIEKGNKVSETYKPSEHPGFSDVDYSLFSGWQTQVRTFLINLLGLKHTYVQSFDKNIEWANISSVKTVQEILNSVREDFSGGYLTDFKMLVSAEIFTDFMEMAEHLLECGYKDPAASLCGAVLEDGLRKIALEKGIKIKSREDIGSLNQKCADKYIYTRLEQKNIEVWNEIRNKADHGKFGEYKKEDVEDMIKKITGFLADYIK